MTADPSRFARRLGLFDAVLASTLPTASIVGGAAVLATGALLWQARRSVSPAGPG